MLSRLEIQVEAVDKAVAKYKIRSIYTYQEFVHSVEARARMRVLQYTQSPTEYRTRRDS